jgi:NTP pyrophosphatase (non-canonical NTP hydrolase)
MNNDTFLHYQESCKKYVQYPPTFKVIYPLIGLCGETGEVAELVKKAIRKGSTWPIERLKEEMGDVLWYVASLANDLGLSLMDIAISNIDKLQKRLEEGTIKDEQR